MNRQDMEARFLLLQINDSLFPIGGYSHSYGLETYIQKGLVNDGSTARLYIENRPALQPSLYGSSGCPAGL